MNRNHLARRTIAGLALLATLSVTDAVNAQIVQASYPLLTDLLDETGQYGPTTLNGNGVPAPSAPDNGVCHDGTYYYGGGQDIRTATISGLDDTDFQIEVDFRITAFTGANRPILVGGNGWRWIGFYTDAAGTLGVLYNNSNYTWSTTTVDAERWYRGVIKFENGNLELFLDGVLVHTATIGTLNTSNDFDFTTNNFSNAQAFYGCVRRIVIANDATLGLGSIGTTVSQGDGCGGLTLDVNSAPTIGNAGFGLQIDGGSLVAPLAYVAFGSSLVSPAADLASIGMAGCFAHSSSDLGTFGPVVLTNGSAPFALPIPNAPIFAGTKVFVQAVSFTPTTALGLSASNGLGITVGQ